jgi:hypothetical protein
MKQYFVLTRNPQFLEVGKWISANNIKYEIHLNRTRFWVPDGPVTTEFLLRYIHCCDEVEE